jgi:tRNA wybutosine-synthesizing protein 2
VLRLPPDLSAWGRQIGSWFQQEMGVRSVWAAGETSGELRRRPARLLSGPGGAVRHQEEGIRWYLDPSEILFAAGNRWERRRAGALVQPGERVADLFAGIGYFSIPAAKYGRPARVDAVEKDATSFAYLLKNIEANGVGATVHPHHGDNREVVLPPGSYDRVFLGLLPTSLPFVPRALELIDPSGGVLHVHLVVSAPQWREEAISRIREALDSEGAKLVEAQARRVKPYGPARSHVVVDVLVRPRAP